MIKWVVTVSALGAGIAFAAGCYVGWKTTLKVVDSLEKGPKRGRDVN